MKQQATKSPKKQRQEFLAGRESLRLEIKTSLASYMEHQAKRIAAQVSVEREEQVQVVAYGADAMYNRDEDRFYVSVFYKLNHKDADLMSGNYVLNPNVFNGKPQPTYVPFLIPEIKMSGESTYGDEIIVAHDLAWDAFRGLLSLYAKRLDDLRNFVKGRPELAGKEVGAHLYLDDKRTVGVVVQVNSDKQVLLGTAKSDEERPYVDGMTEAVGIEELRNVVSKTRERVPAGELGFFDYMVDLIFAQLKDHGWETVQTLSADELPKYVDETVAEATRLIHEIRDDADAKATAAYPYGLAVDGLRISNQFRLYYTAGAYAVPCEDSDALLVLARRTPMRVWMQVEPKLIELFHEILDEKDVTMPDRAPLKQPEAVTE